MKVTPLNEKVWNDKKFWEVEAEHEGATVKASIWPPFPTQFIPGQEAEINGTLTQNAKGYWSIKTNPMGTRPGWAKSKSAEIKEAQDRKEESISYFNSCNLAVQSMAGIWDEQMFKQRRDFFLQEYRLWSVSK